MHSRQLLKLFVLLGLCVSTVTFAANIAITKIRDLGFLTAAQGDPAATVNPGTLQSAQYTVTGNPNAQYTITLPSTASMKNGSNTISASSFTSTPASPGQLDGAGNQTLYVGATRAAIPVGQATGTYSASFAVVVRYTTGGKNATASATASVPVIATLGLSKVSDLSFGSGVQGDSSKIITAGGAGSAQFTVSGEPNTAYNITLPTNALMTTGDGVGATKQVTVGTFTSSPSGSGSLGAGGSQSLYVGATRAALLSNQVTGSYSGSFTVTVAY